MKLKLLLVTVLLFGFLTKAQNLNDEKLMGEWEAVNVDIPNSDEVPQKESLKMVEDAFLNSKFNFKGNKVFRIEFGKLADERMTELFFLDNQNWLIKNDQILIGTENDGFSSMHIVFQENNGKTYFILPMITLEMQKLSDDVPSPPRVITSKFEEKPVKVEDSKAGLVNKKFDESRIFKVTEVENPAVAPKCKPKWDMERKKKCTNRFIQQHILRKFDTDLAARTGLTGKIEIMVEFVIDTTGKAVNVTASGGPAIMNRNAVEVIKLLPNLNPGMKDGKPIHVSYKVPLKFEVYDKENRW